MGYQESFIFTNRANVKKNNEDIEKLETIFKKYDIRCSGDEECECSSIVHIREQAGKYPEGMALLLIAGERSGQRDTGCLFQWDPDSGAAISEDTPPYTTEEKDLIRNVKIVFLENAPELMKAMEIGAATAKKLKLLPELPLNHAQIKKMGKEIRACIPKPEKIKDDAQVEEIAHAIGEVVERYGYTLSKSNEIATVANGSKRNDKNFYINGFEIGSISYLTWDKRYSVYFYDLQPGQALRKLARNLQTSGQVK